jgi:sensor domain CHASE-containing protein
MNHSWQAILSTVFFDHGQHHIAVSRQWWIFPALVLPLTIIVFAVWYAWLRWRFVRENASQDHQEEALRL